jgi:transposase
MDLTNEQWQRIVESFPHPRAQPDSSRWPLQDFRAVLNRILWVLQTGAPWADLPARCPPKSTCHRRFQEWTASGVFGEILTALAEDLRDRGGIDLSEGFIDGTFAPAKEGAMVWVKPNGAKAPKSWALQTLAVFLSPLAQPAIVRMK